MMPQPTTHTDSPDEELRKEQIRRNQTAIQPLNAWEQEDEEEQRETWEFLMRALERTGSRFGNSSRDCPVGCRTARQAT